MNARSCPHLLSLLILASGCEPTDSPVELTVHEIVIPLQPSTEGPLPFWTPARVSYAERTRESRLELEARIDLALGEAYPRKFRVQPPESLWATCGQLIGQVRFDEVHEWERPIGTRLSNGELEIDAKTTGLVHVRLQATISIEKPNSCRLPVGALVPVDVSLRVRAFEPMGTTFDLPFGCTQDELLMAPSVALHGQGAFASDTAFRVGLVGEGGERMFAANAKPEAQATVRLRGRFAADEASPSTLSEWLAPPASGLVEVVSELGGELRIEVIDPARITRAEVQFQLLGAKTSTPLEDGVGYGEQGWGASYNRIDAVVMGLYVGETGLCSSPSPSWFELEAQTPSTCAALEVSRQDTGPGHRLNRAARLLSDGTCTLELRAPKMSADAGLPIHLSARFHNVSELWEP